jgi:ketosteroid isomerase-like protein
MSENVEVARRAWELWNEGADDEVALLLAPDVEWHHQIGLGTPLEGVYRGRQEVLEMFAAFRDAFDVARIELEEVRDLSSVQVLVLGHLHLEGRGSGLAVTTPIGAVTEVREGLTVRQRFWSDQGKALEAAAVRE